MWHNTLGRTGSVVSALACGSNALRLYDPFTAEIVFNYALDHGITLIETGRMYDEGRTEDWIGKAVSHRRSEYVLASKCWCGSSYEDAARQIDQSLEALQTDHIDHYRLAPVDSHEMLARALAPDGAQRAIEEAREAGKISYTGLTGHQPEVLMAALRTGRFDTVLFVHNMVTYNEQNRRLIQLATDLGVGLMLMRPLDHGALRPDPALRFALASGVDTVLCGMYSPLEIDRNLALAGAEPDELERASLHQEAEALSTGCLRCQGADGPPCKCPLGIDVRQVMLLGRYRAKYGLLPAAELQWSTLAEAAKRCNECMQCEERCPAGLRIVPSIHEAAR
ncbi:MAG: aldo/keto reductase [Anaerolineae bacterium]|nr:aldo/keto reductase [Anaerolineae bacterium]